jgi:hypothetical protein
MSRLSVRHVPTKKVPARVKEEKTHFPRFETIGSHSCPAVRQCEQGVESVRSHRTRRKLQDLHAIFVFDGVVGIFAAEPRYIQGAGVVHASSTCVSRRRSGFGYQSRDYAHPGNGTRWRGASVRLQFGRQSFMDIIILDEKSYT